MSQIPHLIKKRKGDNFNNQNCQDFEGNNNFMLIHQKWEVYCRALLPGIFTSLDSATNSMCQRFFGGRSCRFSFNGFYDQLVKSHPNHKHYYQLFHLSISGINGIIRDRQIDVSNYYFTSQRALKNNDGIYELLKVITQPYSYSDGLVIDYLSWYIPIKVYEGEPFTSDIQQLIPIEDSSFERLKLIFYDSKKEMIDYMHFTARQREVIHLMALGLSKSELAEKMNISIRTIEKYNQQILSKGHDLFPLNRFLTATDVVEYLQKLGVV